MHSTFVLAALALPFALAAPFNAPSEIVRRQDNDSTCNVAGTTQPANTLTPPTADLTLVLIALGQGTQNYTCANSSATAAPTSIGAVAQLFNASCAVASNEANLGAITESNNAIGAHFFFDNTTPEFDIIGLGNTQTKKIDVDSTSSTAANVPWLRLEAQASGTTSSVKQIYRLNTNGGVAPKNCEGQQPVVTVQYTAQYWVYASTAEINARRKRRGLDTPVA